MNLVVFAPKHSVFWSLDQAMHSSLNEEIRPSCTYSNVIFDYLIYSIVTFEPIYRGVTGGKRCTSIVLFSLHKIWLPSWHLNSWKLMKSWKVKNYLTHKMARLYGDKKARYACIQGRREGGGRGGNLPQGLRYSGAPNARSQCSNGPGWGPLPDRYAPGLNLSLGGPACISISGDRP